MNFNLDEAIEVLVRTPLTIEQLLKGISECWLQCNEGEGTWNAYEVVNHLIEADDTNWIPRLERMLQDGSTSPLPPFDRFSHLNQSAHIPIEERLIEFKNIRAHNIMKLKSLVHTERDLEKTGLHPEFGTVKIKELLSTWVVHDLTHISQIIRVMAKRYNTDVGPWKAYLSILKSKK